MSQYAVVPATPPHARTRRRTDDGYLAVIAYALVLGIVYLVAARLGLMLVAQPEQVAVLWPASGIAAGALIILGRRARAAIAVAVMAATLTANIMVRSSVDVAAAFAVCNALECLVVFWIIEVLDRSQHRLESLRSVLVFLFAAIAGPAIAAVPAAMSLHGLGLSSSPIFMVWKAWVASDALGIVILAPVLIAVRALVRNPPQLSTILEGSAGILLLVIGMAYAFGLIPARDGLPLVAPAVVAFPLLLWIASRAPPAFSAVAALAGGSIIIAAALAGAGRFANIQISQAQHIQSAQFSVLATSLCALALAAVFAGSRNVAAALIESEQRMTLALSAAGIYAFDYDLVRGTVYRMGALADKLGLRSNGRVDDYVERIHPDDRAQFGTMLRTLDADAPAFTSVIRLLGNDGHYLTVQHRAGGVFDGRRRLIRIIGSCIDVTRAQAAESALKANEERLRKVMEAGRIFTFDSNASGSQITRSANVCDILGLPCDMANAPLSILLPYVPAEDRLIFSRGRQALTPDAPHHTAAFRFNSPEGRQVWLEVIERANFDAQGTLIGLSGLTRDVTTRKIAEDKRDSLIVELNHRVNNMLALVATVVRRTKVGHESLEDYVKVLTGRLASLARPHHRLSKNQYAGVGLETLLEDELQAFISADNITLEGPPIVLVPDMAQAMSLTLHELVTNAAKYGALSENSGRLMVEWRIEQVEPDGRCLKLIWKERTKSPITPPQTEGYGTSTIRNQLRHEFKARVDLVFEDDGAKCTIELPLDLNGPDDPIDSQPVVS